MTYPNNVDIPVLAECVVIGSSGFPFAAGDVINLAFDGVTVSCRAAEQAALFSLVEVVEISITGPGSVTTGGGFLGGGFGFEGAMQGIAIASVLNMLTTKTKIHTFVSLITNFGELHLHYGSMEPGVLRMSLSGVYSQLRRFDPNWIQKRQDLITAQLEAGKISTEQAQTLSVRLASGPLWPNPKGDAEAKRLIEQQEREAALEAGPKGTCPDCEKIIPLESERCPFCKANFGEYSSWKVRPL